MTIPCRKPLSQVIALDQLLFCERDELTKSLLFLCFFIQCESPENLYTPTPEGIGNSAGGWAEEGIVKMELYHRVMLHTV